MRFWLGSALCKIGISWSASLKDRRHVVRALTDGARAKFNISASDLGPADILNAADLGFAAAGSSSAEVEERLMSLEKFLRQKESDGEFEIFEFVWEVFAYGDISDR